MNKENKNKTLAANGAEDEFLMPDGYTGEDLFPSSEEQEEHKKGQHPEEENMTRTGKEGAQKRSFRQEFYELLSQKPELKDKIAAGEKLPREVIVQCMKTGISLRTAYAEYEAKQAKSEAEKLRRENEILRQNSSAAAKAPVKGTAAGGGTDTKGKDPFLEGLLSEE